MVKVRAAIQEAILTSLGGRGRPELDLKWSSRTRTSVTVTEVVTSRVRL